MCYVDYVAKPNGSRVSGRARLDSSSGSGSTPAAKFEARFGRK